MKSKKTSIFFNLKTIAVFLLLFATTDIVFAGQTIDEVRKKWIGVNINTLIEKHGYPDHSSTVPNGNTVYIVIKNIKKFYPVPILKQPERQEMDIYNTKTGAYSYGTTTTGNGLTIEHQIQKTECAGYFEVNKDNIIVDIKFKGEECPQ
ncbi:MAG: hypothetical protein FP814_09015 [Desulfobacterium sp.]|nr:hypothetical protein [Desulfobacterium sp.]MBU3947923.1 hypothetical protein [Pseudomonadota bacterium]MBU4011475.1 hypothetical protein [Pseudomonadota bacterium]MBU4035485.1 hypothetical protein [Pseudomonadota bacterium]